MVSEGWKHYELRVVAEDTVLQQISLDMCQGISDTASFRRCNPLGACAMPSLASEQATIHVIDDDASMRSALEALFETVGLRTEVYATAREFLAASRADNPGCIVIDVRLPDTNGLDFQALLVELGVLLPVVLMTGYGDIPMSVRAMKRGAVDFPAKPFHDQDMLDAVMAAIERDRERRTVDGNFSRMQRRFETLTSREQMISAREWYVRIAS
jgi:FixJ family two-component response regulator